MIAIELTFRKKVRIPRELSAAMYGSVRKITASERRSQPLPAFQALVQDPSGTLPRDLESFLTGAQVAGEAPLREGPSSFRHALREGTSHSRSEAELIVGV